MLDRFHEGVDALYMFGAEFPDIDRAPKRDAILGKNNRLLERAARIPAADFGALIIKLKAIARDHKTGGSTGCDALLRSVFDDIERLAPGPARMTDDDANVRVWGAERAQAMADALEREVAAMRPQFLARVA
jgi:hypothetical protein